MDPKSLILFFSLKQPRRIKVIENILIGRKTVSTLYWGMRYGILDYLGSLKHLNLVVSQRSLGHLVSRHLIEARDDSQYCLTVDGAQLAVKIRQQFYQPRFLSANLKYDLSRLRGRWLLAVQVISEYSYRIKNYYPIQIDFRDSTLIKHWFYEFKSADLVAKFIDLVSALMKFLDQFDTSLSWQAASSLVGKSNVGMTLTQQSQILNQPVTEMKFRQIDTLGALIKIILDRPQPFSRELLEGLRQSPVSNSALTTYRLAHRMNFSQIAKVQSIKLSTVKEHLLTVAIFKSQTFPFRQFLPKDLIKKFQQIYSGNQDDWQFSRFQQVFNQPVDFFYFRLYQIMRSNND